MAALAACCLPTSCSSDNSEELYVNQKTVKVVDMVPKAKPLQLTREQKVFVNDNNTFALKFLKTVNETDQGSKSFIYSPLSITYVLGMVNDAATGQTEQELEQTLGFHEGGIQAVNNYCKNLIDNLPKVDEKVTLNIANAIFLNKKYQLKKQFQEDMKEYYDAEAEALDFSSPKTLNHINNWCDNKTNGMIPSILDNIDPDMVSYLLNAIYFKADWISKFDPKDTRTENFTTKNGTTQLPLMHQDVLISYAKNETYSSIMMPYGNGYWNMVVMLPEEGKSTDDIIHRLTSAQYNHSDGFSGTMKEYSTYEVDLKLPRHETSSDTDNLQGGLIGLLQKLGIHQVFNPDCTEISNMCEWPIHIAMMRQKAKIKVNEEGAEAAAVTIAGTYTTTKADAPMAPPKATFHANRPFIYLIYEASSGVILFVGRFTGE